MNFWHMQLHPNEASEWSRNDIINLLEEGVIGVGEKWRNDHNCPQRFCNEMSIGDIVLVRHNGPLALVQVTSNSFENPDGIEVDAWFYYCREIKILALNIDGDIVQKYRQKHRNKNWNEGLYCPVTMDTANYCLFIRFWYDYILKEKAIEHAVEPSIYAVNEILQQNLSIPPYQRPYKWEKNQVEQLLNDIYNHKNSNNNKNRYRIGSLILCIDRTIKKDSNFKDFSIDIVDGQQRITTLLLILSILNPTLSNDLFNNLEYNHSSSYENIQKNKIVIDEWIKDKVLSKKDCIELFNYITNKCELVQVVVYNISEAFQMFDSQNGTGKELEPYNLLKAYHLRAIKDPSLQKEFDIRWEDSVKYYYDKEVKNIDILKQLFSEQLYRTRIWSKNEYAYTFSKQKIDEFKGLSINESTIAEYPYFTPILLKYSISNFLKQKNHNTDSAIFNNYLNELNTKDLLSLNQIIINGEIFFEYINKYTELYKNLFMSDLDTNGFQTFYQKYCLYDKKDRNGDRYLRELYKSLIISVYDRFGNKGLTPAIYQMLYAFVFKNRIEMRSVFYRSVVNIPIDSEKNPFDIINRAKSNSEIKVLEKLCMIDLKTIQDVRKEHEDKTKKRKSARFVSEIIEFFSKEENQKYIIKGELE